MKDTTKYKEILENELEELKQELTKLGIKDPHDAKGWSVKNPEFDITPGDDNEVGDKNEELHINSIILDELTVRFTNIKNALEKIEDSTYGVCEVGGESIEEDRLQANPAARTCKKHMDETEKLDV